MELALVKVGSQALKDSTTSSLAFLNYPEEQVLGPEDVVAEPEGLGQGQGEDLFDAGGEIKDGLRIDGQLRRAGRGDVRVPGLLLELLSDLLQGNVERFQDFGGPLALPDQADEQVLRTD